MAGAEAEPGAGGRCADRSAAAGRGDRRCGAPPSRSRGRCPPAPGPRHRGGREGFARGVAQGQTLTQAQGSPAKSVQIPDRNQLGFVAVAQQPEAPIAGITGNGGKAPEAAAIAAFGRKHAVGHQLPASRKRAGQQRRRLWWRWRGKGNQAAARGADSTREGARRSPGSPAGASRS